MISDELFAIWWCGLISPLSKFIVFNVISFILPVGENQVKQWSSQESCNYRIEFWKNSGFERIGTQASQILIGDSTNQATKPHAGSMGTSRGFLFPVAANFILIFYKANQFWVCYL